MCILMTAPSKTLRHVLLGTPGLLASAFESNPDGYGVMYGTAKRGPKIIRKLPKTLAELRQLVEQLPQDDRQVAMHLRWRTHGAIDLSNVHPVAIEGGGYLMHNGVLDTGNAADKTKSDTWHYARNYLDGAITPAIHGSRLLKMLGEHIEGNVFAIMTDDGQISVVNKKRGVEYEGVFFSNTYAWDVSTLDPKFPEKVSYAGFSHGARGGAYATARYNASVVEEFADAVFQADAWGALELLNSEEFDLGAAIDEVMGYYSATPVKKAAEQADRDEAALMEALIGVDYEKALDLALEVSDSSLIFVLCEALVWSPYGEIGEDRYLNSEDVGGPDSGVPSDAFKSLHDYTDAEIAELYAA